MELPGGLVGRLRDALADTFTRKLLEQLLRVHLNESLDAIVALEVNLTDTAFALIQWANSRGRIRDLTAAIRSERPDRPDLLAICDEVDLAKACPTDQPPNTSRMFDEKTPRIHRLFFYGYIDYETLGKTFRQPWAFTPVDYKGIELMETPQWNGVAYEIPATGGNPK